MAAGRIRRSARRGVALAVLGWLVVAAFSVLGAPSASAAKAVTIEIKNLTPPVASVDPGGTVTFVNKIPPANRGGVSIPLVGSFSATVYTDVAVTFFNQEKKLQLNQSAAWTFTAPATTGTITYTYRIVPQAGLAAAVANQVVAKVAAALPKLPLPAPYIVQTVAPAVPNLPSVNLPALPQVTVQVPTLPGGTTLPDPTGQPTVPDPTGVTVPTQPQSAPPQNVYVYRTGAGAPQLSPDDSAAAAAFDPGRYDGSGSSSSSGGEAGGGSGGGSGGVAGGYDGASVPVFGELAGLDGSLDDQSSSTAADTSPAAQSLPAAALAAVIALAAVTAALVRTHQASRASR